jgi:hypothetical protein
MIDGARPGDLAVEPVPAPATDPDATALFFSDMEHCLPAEALSWTPKPGKWRLIPYRTELFDGTLLNATHETDAPDLTYRLSVTGWHRISIGVYQLRNDEIEAVEVRLSDDRAFCVLTVPSGPEWTFFEVYWKTADLTGQDIHIRQLKSAWDAMDRPGIVPRPAAKARVGYVRLDPLTDSEVEEHQTERRERSSKTLYAHDDAHGFIWLHGAREPEQIYRELEPFRDSDFSRMYWEAGFGDILFYLGKAGRLPTCDGLEDHDSLGNRLHAEVWRHFRDRNIDPFRLALDYAHEVGLEFHGCYRPAGFCFPPPEDHWNPGGFYEQHPELRAINRDGSVAARTSYTFPETRRYVLSVLREIAEYGVDGIAILYIRRPPLVGYEPPIVEAFRTETDLDARELAEDDERWLRFRCRVLNGFMREVRAEMDAVAREQGRSNPIAITAMVSGREDENILHGMDVAAWVAEGTVDTLIPYTMAPDLDSSAEAWPDPAAARYWLDLVKGTSTTVSFSILPRWKSPEDYQRAARALYQEGAQSLFFWDCGGQRVNFMDQFAWNAMRRLGHRDEVMSDRDLGDPRPGAPGFGNEIGVIAVPVGRPSEDAPTRRVLDVGGYDMRLGTPG